MEKLLAEIRNCKTCLPFLEHGVHPVLSAHPKSKIAIIGQAPGSIVHKTGIPWDDKSGERLRDWLGVDTSGFYNAELFALIPMGFCYPGKGKSGDLPPRGECAPQWHKLLFRSLNEIDLILLIGSYAQKYYLNDRAKNTLTETVQNFEAYLPKYLPLPHPSPRNNIWFKKNPWFNDDLIPVLREEIMRYQI
ncbi:uracil-DNA glycosylase family protein [Candidatus Haliotispira prima]|uniref:Uracil-DNA glycosylase family protein n=1 Tax=Candidatus Haliotispira prima TaxID=3034016 RepID=A0ABY8MFM1_9SPIO|nr:uracil-DNA glycosylase family protein [Candidatus Haliotispira prima]